MRRPTKVAMVAVYKPGRDAHGAPIDAWTAPTPVEVFGWAPTGGILKNQPVEGNRRPVIVELEVFAPAPVGGPRAQWTLPKRGVFEQVGESADYRDGPWWPDSGAVIGLTKTEG